MKWMTVFLIYSQCYAFHQVVIWGHKLHSHTHSYIHEAFYKTFQRLGYQTFWLDQSDHLDSFDFSNTLFITEGQVDEGIPLRQDCKYMLHNCISPKYHQLSEANYFTFQVYNKTIHAIPDLVKLDHCIYYDLPGRCIYMPWATDLFPEEIELQKHQIMTIEPYIYWVGTIGEGMFGNQEELISFIRACEENGIAFIHCNQIDQEEHIHLIQSSFLAPAIVGTWQQEVDYIPCRIFKNISYGKFGITNSRIVYELFDKKIVYNPDPYQLFYDAINKMKNLTTHELHELMDIVKAKHTYINRAETLLYFLELVEKTYK